MSVTADSVLVVIPARLHSTRLPSKVLLRETGRYLVQHVYERALRIEGADEVVIATDHPSVAEAAASFGAPVVPTSPDHPSGTDRAAEVARGRRASLVVNLQADEPEMEPADVEALIQAMRRTKAVVDEAGGARDFRREPTPGAKRHLGIYAFAAGFLQRFTRLAPSPREKERRLEQMRALDNGTPLLAVTASHKGVGIDTPEDYAAFVERWRSA